MQFHSVWELQCERGGAALDKQIRGKQLSALMRELSADRHWWRVLCTAGGAGILRFPATVLVHRNLQSDQHHHSQTTTAAFRNGYQPKRSQLGPFAYKCPPLPWNKAVTSVLLPNIDIHLLSAPADPTFASQHRLEDNKKNHRRGGGRKKKPRLLLTKVARFDPRLHRGSVCSHRSARNCR